MIMAKRLEWGRSAGIMNRKAKEILEVMTKFGILMAVMSKLAAA